MSIEAERRVLGAILRGWEPAMILDYADFAHAPHGAIYEACQRVHVSDAPLSVDAVWAVLAAREDWIDRHNVWHEGQERSGALLLHGGRAYLEGLMAEPEATRADVVLLKREALLRAQRIERDRFKARWGAWRKQ